jgi:DNA-binding transcriptional regulator YiaG
MQDRDQTFYEAAARYEELLRTGRVVGIREFAAGYAPELRDELAEYLELGLALGDLPLAQTLTTEEQSAVDRVAARMRERLQAQAAPAPVQTLTQLRGGAKSSLGAFARQIKLPVDLLARIERGAVDPTTIPQQLVERMAEALGRAADEVRGALAQPQLAPAGVRLNAQQGTQPAAEQVVSFAEALAQSSATPEQRAEWSE